MCKINIFDKISFVLVIIAALNLGVIALTNQNLFSLLAFGVPVILRGIYLLIAVAAIDLISLLFRSNIVFFKN
ncbi:MAG: DUF378 domain-containing protein [Clostridium sp.]